MGLDITMMNMGSSREFGKYDDTQGCVMVEFSLGNRIKVYLWRYMGLLFYYDSYPFTDSRFIGS